jgi:hypothetical protein
VAQKEGIRTGELAPRDKAFARSPLQNDEAWLQMNVEESNKNI